MCAADLDDFKRFLLAQAARYFNTVLAYLNDGISFLCAYNG